MVILYNLNDFSTILKTINNYPVESDILDNINKLLQDIEVQDVKLNYKNKKYNNYLLGIKNFQKTEIKTNEIHNKIINILNKLTDNSYQEQKKHLFNLLQDENIIDINNYFYTLYENLVKNIKCNKNFIDLYVKLYKELESSYIYFTNIIENLCIMVEEKIINMKKIDFNNYDDLCEFNKKNDENKNVLIFLLKISKNNEKQNKSIEIIFSKVLTTFINNLLIFEEKNYNEILIEYIYIFLINSENLYDLYKLKIDEISNYKINNYKGLSNKIIFKIMDLIDYYN